VPYVLCILYLKDRKYSLYRVRVPRDSWPHFYCVKLETPPTPKGQVPVFNYPRYRVAQGKVKVKVILWPTASRSICLGVRHPSETGEPIWLLPSLIIFRQLTNLLIRAPSLTRSRVCSFQFIASAAFLSSESHGTHENILLSLVLRLPEPGGPGSCMLYSPALIYKTNANHQ
jgi:hypothetical protein